MKNLPKLIAAMPATTDPRVSGYVDTVLGVLTTAVQLANVSTEDLELLVIAVQDFAGERARVHAADRQGAEAEASQFIARIAQT